MHDTPYWKLSSFYLFYFASLGAFVPYWSLYLKSLGFDAQTISELMAVIMLTKLVAPYIWAWLADHTGRHMLLVQVSSILAVICFTGVFFGQSYAWLAITMASFSFFWNAALPQMETTTLAHLGKNVQRYSHIRLWGSIGFIITVMLGGWVFESISIAWLPTFLLALFITIWLSSLLIPEHKTEITTTAHEPIGKILFKPTVIALLLAALVMQASHGSYYIFYSIYLENHGYSRDIIGQLWALGVIAEVVLFIFMHKFLERFAAAYLLMLSIFLTAIRWLLIGYFVDSLPILLFAQLFHAASYGIFHASAIHLVHQYFVGKLRARGQALYVSLSFGAGGAIGSLISGYTWTHFSPQLSYIVASVLCFIALWISWMWLNVEEKTVCISK